MTSPNSATPISQFRSRGLRKAPVKKLRSACTTMAARKISVAQWCICRISRPPRTSKLISSDEAYASLIVTPFSGT
ncbi:hypothetical protein GCM10009850_008770 [Nonomuraea monospora]|uniref:Uncharacterized protein n=1 Tax=Nonomuraea monospora TaxID=568818 RepID=A0ABN3C9B9_9ACTN